MRASVSASLAAVAVLAALLLSGCSSGARGEPWIAESGEQQGDLVIVDGDRLTSIVLRSGSDAHRCAALGLVVETLHAGELAPNEFEESEDFYIYAADGKVSDNRRYVHWTRPDAPVEYLSLRSDRFVSEPGQITITEAGHDSDDVVTSFVLLDSERGQAVLEGYCGH